MQNVFNCSHSPTRTEGQSFLVASPTGGKLLSESLSHAHLRIADSDFYYFF